jgi:WD40 repeat protein
MTRLAFLLSLGILAASRAAAAEEKTLAPVSVTQTAGPIYSFALIGDGKQAVIGGDSGLIRIVDVASGAVLRTLEGPKGEVSGVAVTPKGDTLVSCGADKTVRVWSLASGKLLRTMTGHTDRVSALALSADGKYAITASWDGSARVWDIAAGRQTAKFTGHTSPLGPGERPLLNAIAAAPKGTLVASCGDDRTRIWDAKSGREVIALAADPRRACAAAITPDGVFALAAVMGTGGLAVFELKTGKEVAELKGHADHEKVTAIRVLPDGKRALSAGSDGKAFLWEIASGRKLAEQTIGEEYHPSFVEIVPGGKRFVTASGGRLAVWSLEGVK